MAKQQKMTKEELQEDKLVEFMVLATKFIEDHMKKIIAAVVVIIIIAGAGWLYSNYHNKMIAEANNLIWEGDKKYEEKAYKDAIDKYDDVLSINSVGNLKGVVYLKIANAYFADKNFAEADKYFELANKALKSDFLKYSALEGTAQVYYAQEKFEEAAKEYEKIVSKMDAVKFKDKAATLTFEAANSYEKANNLEKAKALYQNIISIYEDTPVKASAEKKLEVLSYK